MSSICAALKERSTLKGLSSAGSLLKAGESSPQQSSWPFCDSQGTFVSCYLCLFFRECLFSAGPCFFCLLVSLELAPTWKEGSLKGEVELGPPVLVNVSYVSVEESPMAWHLLRL